MSNDVWLYSYKTKVIYDHIYVYVFIYKIDLIWVCESVHVCVCVYGSLSVHDWVSGCARVYVGLNYLW